MDFHLSNVPHSYRQSEKDVVGMGFHRVEPWFSPVDQGGETVRCQKRVSPLTFVSVAGLRAWKILRRVSRVETE